MYHPIVECKKATITLEWKTSKGYGNMAGFLFFSIFIPSSPDVSWKRPSLPDDLLLQAIKFKSWEITARDLVYLNFSYCAIFLLWAKVYKPLSVVITLSRKQLGAS